MSRAQQAFELFEQGLTWREVGEALGTSRTNAKNAGHYWRKRIERGEKARKRYSEDPDYRARKIEQATRYGASEHGREVRAAHRARNREKLRRQHRESRERHGEKWNANRRRRYATDPEYRQAMLDAARRYAEENPEKIAAYGRQYNVEHREELAEYRRRWRAAGGAELERQYKASRREHNREVFKRWKARNLDALKASRQRYHFANRKRILMARSVWQFGPDWGPVHRALNDLRAKLRED